MSGGDDDRNLYESRLNEMFGEIEQYYSSGEADRDLARTLAATRRARKRPQLLPQQAGYSGEERILSSEEVEAARQQGTVFISLMRRLAGAMSARDRIQYAIGLHAAHLEEALATGDFDRAHAHYKALIGIASRLTR